MKKLASFLALALAALALVACGSSDDDSTTTATNGGNTTENSSEASGGVKEEKSSGGGGAASTLKFEADPDGALAYTTTSATTKAGEVTIDFKNPQSLIHDVAIESADGEEVGKTDLIDSGSDSTTVELKPGSYTFFCSVPGHREAGMEGTLTVK